MRYNVDQDQVSLVDETTDVVRVMRNITESGMQEDAFYVFDAQNVIQKLNNWREKMPRVVPFYAVKCNDHVFLLKVLASLGVSFDCASQEEMRKVLAIGVEPSRIIFANPAKPMKHIRYAAEQGVDLITFDNENELYKMKSVYPASRLLLRIRSDAAVTQCPLGIKYGCNITTEAPQLLNLARELDLNVVGICFHVGSGCGEALAYGRSIAAASTLFKVGRDLGFDMHVLDIGGGFPGNKGTSIDKMAEIVNKALDEYFPNDDVKIMGEPGRYFAASAYTLAALVHSKREDYHPETGARRNMYYINDGVYGSFNSILYDHAEVTPLPLQEVDSYSVVDCSIWGPTCDGLDKIVEEANFPEMNVGDWIRFDNMGAYTFAAASTFNGFDVPKVYTILNESTMNRLKNGLLDVEKFDFEGLPESVDKNNQYLLDERQEKHSSSRSVNGTGFDVSAERTYIST